MGMVICANLIDPINYGCGKCVLCLIDPINYGRLTVFSSYVKNLRCFY